MNFSKRELYAAGEPLGESATQHKPFGRIYGGGGGGGTQTSTSQMTIPDELKPAATAMSNVATQVGNSTWSPYSGQGVAPMNQLQNTAMGLTAQRALGGDQTINAGNQYLQNFLQGGPQSATVNPYAQQGNPYLDAMVNKAQTNVLSNAQGAAVRSGSFGNSGIAESAAKQMSDVASQMYGNAWGQQAQLAEAGAGRNDNMMQSYAGNALNAAQLGLNYGNQAYQDAGQLMNMGTQAYNVAQDQNDFNYQQYMNQQNYPLQQLQALTGVLRGNSGTTTTTTGGGGK
jgi:hypothetical protein